MPSMNLKEAQFGPHTKCLGTDYITTYTVAKPLVTTEVTGTTRKKVPPATRWVIITVRGATLVIQTEGGGTAPSATVGHDFAVGTYTMDWDAHALDLMQAFSTGAATLFISYWGVE